MPVVYLCCVSFMAACCGISLHIKRPVMTCAVVVSFLTNWITIHRRLPTPTKQRTLPEYELYKTSVSSGANRHQPDHLLQLNPNAPWDCHRTADQSGWCQGGQWHIFQSHGLYGKHAELLSQRGFFDQPPGATPHERTPTGVTPTRGCWELGMRFDSRGFSKPPNLG